MASSEMQKTNRKKKLIALVAVVIVVIALVAGVFLYFSTPDLTISLNNTSASVQRGTIQTIQVSLAARNALSGAVSLSVSGLPANVTANFSNSNPQLAAGGNARTDLTVAVGNYAYGQNSTLKIIASSGGLTREADLLLTVIGNTYNYYLGGSYAGGWNVTSIRATEGDILVLHLTSKDSLTHALFVDYNGNGTPDGTEPLSPNFASPTTPVTLGFTITQVGTFTYYCKYHPNMTGTLHSATP